MSFDAQVRHPKAEAYVYYANPAFDTSMTVTVTGGDYCGTKDQVNDGYTYPSKKWFVVGESSLDSGDAIYGSNLNQIGWLSTTRSNSDGSITGTVQTLLEFSSRSVSVVSVYGDISRDVYPVDFTIELYYSGSWHTEKNVTGNGNSRYSSDLSSTVNAVTKARLTITKWSDGESYINIVEFGLDNTAHLTEADIQNIKTHVDYMVEGLGIPWGSCAAGELSMTYKRDNDLQLADYRVNVPINVMFGYKSGGSTTLLSYGQFYASDWTINGNMITVVAHNLVARLSDVTFSAINYGTFQRYSKIIQDIMNEVGFNAIIPTITEGVNWIIFRPVNALEALKTVMQAAGMACYVNTSNYIVFELIGASKTSVKTLDNSTHILDGGSNTVDLKSMATKFDIYYYEFTKASSKTNVIESLETITFAASESKTLIYNFPDSIESADEITSGDVTLSSVNFYLDALYTYSWGVALTIRNLLGSPQDLASVTVQGKAITTAERIYSTIDTDAQSKYGTITYTMKNKLVQSYDRAIEIANSLKSLYTAPDKVSSLPTRSDPWTVIPSKQITVPDGAGTKDVIVQTQEISFDGTLNDKLTVREA